MRAATSAWDVELVEREAADSENLVAEDEGEVEDEGEMRL